MAALVRGLPHAFAPELGHECVEDRRAEPGTARIAPPVNAHERELPACSTGVARMAAAVESAPIRRHLRAVRSPILTTSVRPPDQQHAPVERDRVLPIVGGERRVLESVAPPPSTMLEQEKA